MKNVNLSSNQHENGVTIMRAVKNVSTFKFDSIPIDSFWNTGTEKEFKMHRIHSYPAKFPAFIATKALEYAVQQEHQVDTMADIFCGCGTTAFEAKRNDIDFWGCDINPVATLIAKVKSEKYQSVRLEKYFNEIIKYFQNRKIVNQYPNANERIKYWYKKKQLNQLAHLKKAIFSKTPDNSKYRLFFLCAFSNILKPTSVWLSKSIKPQVDPNKVPMGVINAFKRQHNLMVKANAEITDIDDHNSKIVTGSFLSGKTSPPKVDMIVTSPPYVTSYEYADLHQLSSLWLGFTDDFRTLREGSIGSKHNDFDFEKEKKSLNTSGEQIVTTLKERQGSKAHSVAKYFIDMQKVAKKSYEMLKKDGMVLFVIGNTEYKGVRIDNAKHLAESLFDVGFVDIKATKRKISNKFLTPYRNKDGKFTTDKKGRKIYSEEFIIVGRK